MPDIKTEKNDLTNRCFHCGKTFEWHGGLQSHLEEHRKTDKGLRKIDTE